VTRVRTRRRPAWVGGRLDGWAMGPIYIAPFFDSARGQWHIHEHALYRIYMVIIHEMPHPRTLRAPLAWAPGAQVTKLTCYMYSLMEREKRSQPWQARALKDVTNNVTQLLLPGFRILLLDELFFRPRILIKEAWGCEDFSLFFIIKLANILSADVIFNQRKVYN
jgi:hypothetical protein